jgi:Xaa-Pro dipeptidase
VVRAAGPGTAALADGAGVDFARLRADRRQRLVGAVAGAGLDALVLGRPANIAYATGARPLWTAGSRPFGPGAIVMADGRVHLQSTWDEGVPEEIAHEALFGLSWNAADIAANLAGVPGLAGAGRIGTDGWSPGAAGLWKGVTPGAEVVDAGSLLARVRAVKTDEELACLRVAAAAAEAGLAAVVAALRPGVSERLLTGVHASALARLGLPTPPIEGAAFGVDRADPHRRRLTSDRRLEAGGLVLLTGGALYAGYEVTVSRTWLVPPGSAGENQKALARRARAGLDARMAECRPGPVRPSLGPEARADREPVGWGTGLGTEEPILGAGLGHGVELVAGSTLEVQAWEAEAGVGGALEADAVVVAEVGGVALTRFSSCPALFG